MEHLAAAKTTLHGFMQNTVNAVKAVPTVSRFLEDGTITPDEFIKAGDLLVSKCPSWSWQPGDPSKAVPYLPKEKQFLITRNVPCHERLKNMENKRMKATEVMVDGTSDPWVLSTQTDTGDQHAAEVRPAGASTPAPKATTTPSSSSASSSKPSIGRANDADDDDGEIPDAETFDVSDNIDHDNAALILEDDNVLRTRTYDLSITYDLYYLTPKVWLFGYDEAHQPLKPQQVFADISEDHAKKTVTIEAQPHLGYPCAFIHPCKHAAVMKKIVQRSLDNNRTPRVDQYLFLFLKFISAVIPTIEYDFTITMEYS